MKLSYRGIRTLQLILFIGSGGLAIDPASAGEKPSTSPTEYSAGDLKKLETKLSPSRKWVHPLLLETWKSREISDWFIKLEIPKSAQVSFLKKNILVLETEDGPILRIERKPLFNLVVNTGKAGAFRYDDKKTCWFSVGDAAYLVGPVHRIHSGNLMSDGYPRMDVILTTRKFALIIDRDTTNYIGGADVQEKIVSSLRFIGGAEELKGYCRER